jgi:hypothetical protein
MITKKVHCGAGPLNFDWMGNRPIDATSCASVVVLNEEW